MQNRRLDHAARERRGVAIGRTGRRLVVADPQLGAQPGRLLRPVAMQAENVCGIARREAADRHQPALDQPFDRLARGIAAGEIRQRDRPVGKRRPDPRLSRRQAVGAGIERPVAQRETARARLETIGLVLRAQYLQHRRTLMAEQTERYQSPRPHQNVIAGAVDLAVAAQTVSMDGDRFHHGPPAGNRSAFPIQHRKTVGEQRDIRGRAAHVGDDDILFAGEMTRADDAGGRARQDRLDRPGQGKFRRDERTVALHDHQRCAHTLFRHQAFDGTDQLLQLGDQSGIEGGGQGPSWGVESRRQFVAAAARFAGEPPDQIARAQFMHRIAHREEA